MPSSKPAGALTLASRTLNPRAALPAQSTQQPPTLRPLPAPLLLRLSPVPILVRSRLLVRLGRAVCLRVWSGVDVAHLTSRALCLSRWHNAVMRARDHIAAPRVCVVPQFVGVSEWLNSFVVYLIRRKPGPRPSGLGRVRRDQEGAVPAACMHSWDSHSGGCSM